MRVREKRRLNRTVSSDFSQNRKYRKCGLLPKPPSKPNGFGLDGSLIFSEKSRSRKGGLHSKVSTKLSGRRWWPCRCPPGTKGPRRNDSRQDTIFGAVAPNELPVIGLRFVLSAAVCPAAHHACSPQLVRSAVCVRGRKIFLALAVSCCHIECKLFAGAACSAAITACQIFDPEASHRSNAMFVALEGNLLCTKSS